MTSESLNFTVYRQNERQSFPLDTWGLRVVSESALACIQFEDEANTKGGKVTSLRHFII